VASVSSARSGALAGCGTHSQNAAAVEGFAVGNDGPLKLVTTLAKGLPKFAGGSGTEGIVVW